MRNASIAVLREIGVETGGSNVQFAIDPASGRMVVIEMNPRVSRSSALASKATGFPIAKVAAKLAVGYTLDEVQNDITGVTPASFEPSIDYVVTKVPRFTFEKFPETEPILSTAMKSVGEAMAVGRTFKESLQKALRSLETGLTGLDEIEVPGDGSARGAAGGSRQGHARPVAGHRPGFPRGPDRGRDQRRLPLRPVVPRADRGDRRHRARRGRARPAEDAAGLRGAEGARLLGCPAGQADRCQGGRGPCRPGVARRAAGVQAHRHLRRRVRGAHALHVFLLRDRPDGRRRGRVREPAQRPAQGGDPGRRAEPDRPGHRVRLLLRACGFRARGCRASRPSWSTATRRRSPPTPTPPTGSISSR